MQSAGDKYDQQRSTSSLAVVCLGLLVAVAAADDGMPPFKITTKRADDRVDVKFEKGTAILSIQSQFGIGQSVIEESGEKWPESVLLRLHLKGLENFKITNGKVTLEGSASIDNGKPRVPLWKDGKEDAPLDASSPYWVDVRIVGTDGKTAKELPLREGYFELALPKMLLKDSRTITVSWIDFYRN